MDNLIYREFNHRKDLQQLANLLEIGFGKELDHDGQQYLTQMRALGNKKQLILPNLSSRISIPKEGYICEIDGKLVGNVSILNFRKQNCFLLVSIVVHPEYRQIGIARELSRRVIMSIRSRQKAPFIWLQVKQNNDIALHMYGSLGFSTEFVRTKYIRSGKQTRKNSKSILSYLHQGIPKQQISTYLRYLKQNYPPEVLIHSPIRETALPDKILWRFLNIINPYQVHNYSIQEKGNYLGTVSVVSSPTNRCFLYLASKPDSATALLDASVAIIQKHHPLSSEFIFDLPAEIDPAPLIQGGFVSKTPLIWMKLMN